MGGFKSLFSGPKIPKAPLPLPAPTIQDVDQNKITEDRLRRQRASGTSGNVVSSLAGSIKDEQASSRISKLLG